MIKSNSNFKIELDEVPNIYVFLSEFMKWHKFTSREINEANLALEEIFVNTFMHGYKNKLPTSKDVVNVNLNVNKDKKLIITYKDKCPVFDPTIDQIKKDPLEIGGCGLILIKSVMNLQYTREGEHNVVTMTLKNSSL